jgi:predicted ferric reductase
VKAVAHISSELTEVTLRSLARPALAKPGQFVMAAFFEGPHFHGCGEYHPYSVSGVQPKGTLVLSIKALGDCTRNIQALEPGVAVRVQGPYGSFLGDRPTAPELWIASGIGITPFLSQLRAAPLTRPTVLIYAHREPRDVPYLAELNRYAAEQSQLHFHDLQLGSELAPLLSLLESLPDLTAHHAYLCGPPPLVEAVRGWLGRHGLPPAQIHFERFDFR